MVEFSTDVWGEILSYFPHLIKRPDHAAAMRDLIDRNVCNRPFIEWWLHLNFYSWYFPPRYVIRSHNPYSRFG